MKTLAIPQTSLLAACLYSILATAGLFYVNLGGAFLSAFVDGLDIGRDQAGFIVSANKYGAAFGALIATFLVKALPWRRSAAVLLVLMVIIDAISSQVSDPQNLIAIRFLHGTVGGISVGFGLSVIARTVNPDRIFGMLLAVQYSFGSLGIWFVPRLVESFGYISVFAVLSMFSIMTLLLLPFIPEVAKSKSSNSKAKINFSFLLVFALIALFLFQSSNMGIADYAFELGKDINLVNTEISNILTVANIISISGGILVYIIGTKYGRTAPLVLGISISAIFTFMLHYSDNITIYFIANTVTGIAWAFVIPYILGLCSSFDSHGQMATLAGFISKVGLATGPLIGALLIVSNGFGLIINLATVALIMAAILIFFASKNTKIHHDKNT
ncbi:MAG: MFS transporter [Flavobacteriaceae bacterium]|nr:MFS transporter [Flavobacteriaceae bacterium]